MNTATGECPARKASRPGLDALMADARRGEFSILLVAAFDRVARSTKNFLEIVDELQRPRNRVHLCAGSYRHERPYGEDVHHADWLASPNWKSSILAERIQAQGCEGHEWKGSSSGVRHSILTTLR